MRTMIIVIFAISAFTQVFGDTDLSKSLPQSPSPDREIAAALMNWVHQLPDFAYNQGITDLQIMENVVGEHPFAVVFREIRSTIKDFRTKAGAVAQENVQPEIVNMIQTVISKETQPIMKMTNDLKSKMKSEAERYSWPMRQFLPKLEKIDNHVEDVYRALRDKVDNTSDWVDSKAKKFENI